MGRLYIRMRDLSGGRSGPMESYDPNDDYDGADPLSDEDLESNEE